MADTYLTVDVKDAALVIECAACGTAVDVTAKGFASAPHKPHVSTCLGCGANLFEGRNGEYVIDAFKRLLAEPPAARIRIRVPR